MTRALESKGRVVAPAALVFLAVSVGVSIGVSNCGGEPQAPPNSTLGESEVAPAAGQPSHPPAADTNEVRGARDEPAPAPSALRFVDVTAASGLGAFHQRAGDSEKLLLWETIAGGVALFDYDEDGALDAWLTNGRASASDTETRDAVFRGDGKGHFEDVTERLGVDDRAYTCGVRTLDVDGDGWCDAYLTNWGPNSFWHNQGGERFRDETDARGLGDPAWSTGSAFLDFDRDGDLDLYVANYVQFDPVWTVEDVPLVEYKGARVCFGPRGLVGAADRFLVNQGEAVFEDASEAVGVVDATGFGFDAVVLDRNEDGWLDVYVANDSVPNYLWENQEGKRFEEVAFRVGAALSMSGSQQAGMGVAVGDWDDDADVDLYVTNFAEDYFTFYRNDGKGQFADVTRRLKLASVTYSYLGWGCGFRDLDLDGDQDLYAMNGHVYPQVDRFELGTSYLQRKLLFENLGDGLFAQPGDAGAPGFLIQSAARGCAAGDVDGDGDVDLLIGNLDGPPLLLANETRTEGSSLFVRLVGKGANREAVGARVQIRVGQRSETRWAGTGGSFLSSDSPWLHFGVGKGEVVGTVEVRWGGGEVGEYEVRGTRLVCTQ